MIIVFASLKGGVGKTTYSALLAVYLSEHREDVVTVDRDYQAALTEVLGAILPAGVSPEDVAMLKVSVSASTGTKIIHYPMMLEAWDVVQKIPFFSLVEAVRSLQGKGVVIVDTGPCRDALLVSSLAAADVVVVPATPSTLALRGVELLAKLISSHPHVNPRKLVVVPSMVTRRNVERARQLIIETVNRVRLAYGLNAEVVDAPLWRFSMVQTARGQQLRRVLEREPRLHESMRILAEAVGVVA